METAIEVRDLVVERGKRRVLHGLSCAIPRGSVTGLLGPSGSGKTTLMRAIVGVQIVKSGTVTVLGQPAGSPALRRRIGYLTQAPSVYADLTVRENARYFASLYKGVTAADADETVDRRRPRRRRRPAGRRPSPAGSGPGLAGLRAGEPAGGADPGRADGRAGPGAARRAVAAVPRAWRPAGTTLLVSSHVMDEAGRCDRLLLIREGDLIADDTPAAIRAPPAPPTWKRRSCTSSAPRKEWRHDTPGFSAARPGASCASCATTTARSACSSWCRCCC